MQDFNTHQKGSQSENIAAKFLEAKGYDIVKRNFRFGKVGEMDIIARDGSTLVFVEVRSASPGSGIDPLESITIRKQKSIRKVAEAYLYVNKIYDCECRFDAVIIEFELGKPKINHLINCM